MCGIVSILGDPGSASPEALTPALEVLRHRGPDGSGVWVGPGGVVGLGHVRLSLVGVDDGAQPIASEDGRIVAVVNGEFYGFEAIRRDLERRGHRFRTRSDSEVAVHLYEDRGLDFVDALRGEFALVLWDGRLERVVAARDRFGIKPLCYAQIGRRLLIASEAKALFALGVRPGWDLAAVHRVLAMQYPPGDRTLFEGVRQLRPGHLLTAAGGAVATRPYWDLDYPRQPPDGRDAEVAEPARALLERLDEAVALRLRAEAPVCCHLSGGLDSATIAALAARHVPRPTCFTVAFDEPGYDELDQARAIAGHVGAELVAVRVSREDIVAHLADAVYFSEGLAINGHLPAKYLLARAIHDAGFKAVLSGEGSDEVLGGYAHLRRDLFLDPAGGLADPGGSVAALRAGNVAMAGIHLAEGESLDLGAAERALGFVPSFLGAKGTLGHRLRPLLAPEFRRTFEAVDPCAKFLGEFDLPGQLAGRCRVDQASYLWTKSSLATYILRTLGDGTEMAHSVEGRLPFLDTQVVEVARGIPVGLKIRGTVEKFVLREAVRGLLPAAAADRPKHPFTAPPLSRYSNSGLDGTVRDIVGGRSFAALPFVDAPAVLRLLDRLPSLSEREQVATDPALMLLISACLLRERFRL